MRVILDENGYVESYALIGCEDWLEAEDPDDFDEDIFMQEFRAYKVVDGKLVKDDDKFDEVTNELILEELRTRRQLECFTIINRGELWYERLTEEQIEELNAWYDAWLDVTDTLEPPEKPAWLE